MLCHNMSHSSLFHSESDPFNVFNTVHHMEIHQEMHKPHTKRPYFLKYLDKLVKMCEIFLYLHLLAIRILIYKPVKTKFKQFHGKVYSLYFCKWIAMQMQ